ncbi:hypothetical protein CTAYLR_004292 [Chrysophaeum taylorii]|uniref:t-SNARE coiled-coil homology domain-containing protein n=1 Tax=Chrysophaeum taylorii TaxID=2483200 RepID=A0AAD7UFS2_9STRA|nr:hypothetical protein CTAYLR_004292 [Chrysophaeum taylorii]
MNPLRFAGEVGAVSRLAELKMQQGDVEMGTVYRKRSPKKEEEEQSAFMSSFFGDVEKVKAGIRTIKNASARIREITEERVLAVTTEAEEKLSLELAPLVEETNKVAKRTKALLEKLGEAEAVGSEVRIRDNLVSTLLRKFDDICKEYQSSQSNYKSEIQKAVKRHIELVKPDVTPEEIDRVMKKGNVVMDEPIKAAYADAEARYQDVLRLEQSVAELHQMFLDFALMTEQQGELLDQIEYQVKAANEYVEDGNEDIEVALVYQAEIYKRWACIAGILVFVLFALLLVSGVFTKKKT